MLWVLAHAAHGTITAAVVTSDTTKAVVQLLLATFRHGTLTYPQLRFFVEGGSRLFEFYLGTLTLASTELCAEIYKQCPPARRYIRKFITHTIIRESFDMTPVDHKKVIAGLNLLRPIVDGLRQPFGGAPGEWESALLHVLVPLLGTEDTHGELANEIMLVSMFQVPLSGCLKGLIKKLPIDDHVRVTVSVFERLIALWDRTSSKHCEVMIAVFEDIVDEMDGDVFDRIHHQLFRRTAECAASDNSVLALKALSLFKLDAFVTYLARHPRTTVQQLTPALIRDAVPHWSAEVNYHLHLALEILMALDCTAPPVAAAAVANGEPPIAAPSNEGAPPSDPSAAGDGEATANDGSGSRSPPDALTDGAAATQAAAKQLRFATGTDETAAPVKSDAPPPAADAVDGGGSPVDDDAAIVVDTTSGAGGDVWVPRNAVERVAFGYARKRLKLDDGAARARLVEYFAALADAGRGQGKKAAERELQLAKAKRALADDERKPLPEFVNNHLHFVFGREVGSGSYSSVKYSKRIEADVPQSLWRSFATKVVSKALIEDTDFHVQIAQEIKLMKDFDHPHISPLYASFEDAKNIYIVMEWCEVGDLFGVVFEKGKGSVSIEWCQFCMAEVASALGYVHDRGYYFGDVKTENMLVTKTGHLRLCDFGSCKSMEEVGAINARWRKGDADYHRDLVGTLDFLAPEIVKKQGVGIAADWWAFGVVLVQLLCGFLPFAGADEPTLVQQIVMAHPTLPVLTDNAVPLILSLLQKNPAARLGFQGVVDHAFFKDVAWRDLASQTPPRLDVGYRPKTDMSDPKFCTRKFSMVYSKTQTGGALPGSLKPIPEETAEACSWDAPQPPPDTPWQPAAAKPRDGVARMDNDLAGYMSTAPVRRRPRPKGK